MVEHMKSHRTHPLEAGSACVFAVATDELDALGNILWGARGHARPDAWFVDRSTYMHGREMGLTHTVHISRKRDFAEVRYRKPVIERRGVVPDVS